MAIMIFIRTHNLLPHTKQQAYVPSPHSPAHHRHARRKVRHATRGDTSICCQGSESTASSGRSWVHLRHSNTSFDTRPFTSCIQSPLNQAPAGSYNASSGFPLPGRLLFGPWSHILCAEVDEGHSQRQSPSAFSLGSGVLVLVKTIS